MMKTYERRDILISLQATIMKSGEEQYNRSLGLLVFKYNIYVYQRSSFCSKWFKDVNYKMFINLR